MIRKKIPQALLLKDAYHYANRILPGNDRGIEYDAGLPGHPRLVKHLPARFPIHCFFEIVPVRDVRGPFQAGILAVRIDIRDPVEYAFIDEDLQPLLQCLAHMVIHQRRIPRGKVNDGQFRVLHLLLDLIGLLDRAVLHILHILIYDPVIVCAAEYKKRSHT